MTTPTPTTLGPDARSVIDSELARLSAPEHGLVVLSGAHQHGAGFAAWLRLSDAPPEDPACLSRFEQRYAGEWESIDDLIVDTVEALGWRENLDDFRTRHSVPATYLMWNRDALLKHVRTTHTLVPLDGLIHAFTR